MYSLSLTLLYFSDIELVLSEPKFTFSCLILPVAIYLNTFWFRKVLVSHREVGYLFKLQEGVACKTKFLMSLD